MVSFSELYLSHKLPSGVLPPEVISRILDFYMETAPWKTTNDVNSSEDRVLIIRTTLYLQRLRLVARNWARVVPFYLFKSLRLQTPGMAERLLEQWEGTLLSSHKSPLRVLSLEHIWCDNEADRDVFIPDFVRLMTIRSMQMDTGAKCIMTFGINLTSLTLTFTNCMVVSSNMVEAVKNIGCLIKLTLIRQGDYPRRVGSNSQSIGELLSVTPTLESLSVSLPYLDDHFLLPGSLPCLRHLWFEYHATSQRALSEISRTTNRTLKAIEYNSADPNNDMSASILSESRLNLECLCIDIIPTNLPRDTSLMFFPKLRCIRTTCWPASDFGLVWLGKPFCRYLRTLVTKYACGRVYWMKALSLMGDGDFHRPSGFKHIIFTSIMGSNLVDDLLVCAFDKHDIQCHFMQEMDFDRILELDIALNGGT